MGDDPPPGLAPRGPWPARPREEVAAPLALLVVAAMALAFLAIADAVGDGSTRDFDARLLLALREAGDANEPIGPRWLEVAFLDLTSLGGQAVVTLVTAAATGFLLVTRKPAAALLVLVAVGGGATLSALLKLAFGRPRPDLVAHLAEVQTASFPSGHATLAAVAYLTLGALLARVQPRRRIKAYVLAVAGLVTLLVGASRVFLGVHWPTDVLAGWCVGAAWAVACWLAALRLQRRGEVEGDDAG